MTTKEQWNNYVKNLNNKTKRKIADYYPELENKNLRELKGIKIIKNEAL